MPIGAKKNQCMYIYNFEAGQRKWCIYVYNFGAGQEENQCTCMLCTLVNGASLYNIVYIYNLLSFTQYSSMTLQKPIHLYFLPTRSCGNAVAWQNQKIMQKLCKDQQHCVSGRILMVTKLVTDKVVSMCRSFILAIYR